MKVIGCSSIAVATIKMVIGRIEKDSKGSMVYDTSSAADKKPFWVFIPERVVKKLQVGDTIVVTCIPNEQLSFATQTVAVTKFNSPTSAEEIYNNRLCENNGKIDIFQ